MARVRVPITVLDLGGNAVSGAAVHVKHRSSGATATIYQNEFGPTTITNPLAANSQGIAPGWIERGAYYADITGTGISPYTQQFDAAPAENRAVDDLWLPSRSTPTLLDDPDPLPTSPQVGDEVYYSFTAGSGGIWHLRWSGAEWQFLGGSAMFQRIGDTGQETVTSLTYTNLATVGPSLTAPLAGMYEFEFGCTSWVASAVNDTIMSVQVGVVPASDNDAIIHGNETATAAGKSGISVQQRDVPAGTTFVAKYRMKAAGTGVFTRRWMRLRPVSLD